MHFLKFDYLNVCFLLNEYRNYTSFIHHIYSSFNNHYSLADSSRTRLSNVKRLRFIFPGPAVAGLNKMHHITLREKIKSSGKTGDLDRIYIVLDKLPLVCACTVIPDCVFLTLVDISESCLNGRNMHVISNLSKKGLNHVWSNHVYSGSLILSQYVIYHICGPVRKFCQNI